MSMASTSVIGRTMSGPRLRICDLLAWFHPVASGAERQAMAQGVELTRRGHSVRVLTQAIPGMDLPRDDEIGGIAVHRWIRPIRRGPLFGLSFVVETIRALRRLRPHYDLIHTHQALWEAVSTGLGRDLIKAPILVQPASSGYFGEASELSRTKGFPILRRLALRNPAFAAISGDIERQWRMLGVPPSNIIRTASGVDRAVFHPGPSAIEDRLPPRPRVLFTGRLHPQKNLEGLIEGWPGIAERTGANLLLLGIGPDRDRLASIASERGVGDRVHFLGAVDDPSEFLRAADLFVLPSVAEGMSNSLLEAMATGLPCVASKIGGNIDLLDDPKAGLLVAPGDREAWSGAILHLLTDRPAAIELGREALRVVSDRYDLKIVVDHYESIYQNMIFGNPQS